MGRTIQYTALAILLNGSMGQMLPRFRPPPSAQAPTSAPVPAQPAAIDPDDGWLAPSALAAAADGKTVWVACARGKCVQEVDLTQERLIRTWKLPGLASGLALAPNQRWLYVTCAGAASRICLIDLARGKLQSEVATGHTAVSPVLTADGQTLLFCLRFENQLVLWDTSRRREARRIAVGREPISVAATADGQFAFVAHHLPAGAASALAVAATVGVVDLSRGMMVKELPLPNGSSLVRDVRISPDGRYATVTHNLARFQVPTTQLDRGWMNTSALTIIDTASREIVNTVLLDEVDRGAANPWALGWSQDGRRLLVSQAGTHDLSVIDFPGLLAKLWALNSGADRGPNPPPAPEDDLSLLVGLRARIPLACNGPRSLVLAREQICVAGYFSDSLDLLQIGEPGQALRSVALQPQPPASVVRVGERLFNDATISFQGWQSCASCHSEDARVDGLNWDLLNDGLGNPKNAKSLVLTHATPPSMSLGVRDTAEVAVRAGLQHILFAAPAEELAAPLDRWLSSLRPQPSPHLEDGKLSVAARRGKKLFDAPRTACASCHIPELFTDLQPYDVGTAGEGDRPGAAFDTPTLVELWRTAPYLHDGSAATLREVLTTRNRQDQHGRTSHLNARDLDDLLAYLLSL